MDEDQKEANTLSTPAAAFCSRETSVPVTARIFMEYNQTCLSWSFMNTIGEITIQRALNEDYLGNVGLLSEGPPLQPRANLPVCSQRGKVCFGFEFFGEF